jgi:hypothetical protein
MRRINEQHGQTIVMTVVFITVLLGMSASVLDVGSWYRADRQAQATADAAALAGAQGVPTSQVLAAVRALEYANKNGGGLLPTDISFPAADQIAVKVQRPAPGFFSRLFGIDSVTVGATATARAAALTEARWVAPIVVSWYNEFMPGGGNPACAPDPCFGPLHTTTLELIDLHRAGSGDAAGAFGLIDLRLGGDGSVGASTLADWMQVGFSGLMKACSREADCEKVEYDSVPSVMFNSNDFRAALNERFQSGKEILIPIYDEITRSGSTADYNIVGWVAFVITSWNARGNGGELTGYFKEVFWDGVQAAPGSNAASYGVLTISLVD